MPTMSPLPQAKQPTLHLKPKARKASYALGPEAPIAALSQDLLPDPEIQRSRNPESRNTLQLFFQNQTSEPPWRRKSIA